METRGLTCDPTSIISFTSDGDSLPALASGSQPTGIISGTAGDGLVEDYHISLGLATAAGVTDVVAIAEVSMAHGPPSMGGGPNSNQYVGLFQYKTVFFVGGDVQAADRRRSLSLSNV